LVLKEGAGACLYRLSFFALTILLTAELRGQSSDTGSGGRAAEIEEQRLDKSAHLHPEEATKIEKTLTRMNHLVRRVPIAVGVAGLGTGAGLTIGSEYQWSNHSNRVSGRLWGSGLLHGFYRAGTGVELKAASAGQLTFALNGWHADSPQLDYYGPGPKSSIHNRTDFRREDTLFEFQTALQPHRHLAQACRVAELLENVGPGTSDSLATTQSKFGPAQAPGVDVQSNYLIGGCSASVDLRDLPEGAHKGTYAELSYNRYHAQGHDQFSFHRVAVMGEQYVPFLNRKRVITLRAKTELSFHSGDQVVPFYLQPTLASDTELRGFRRYRFYDENSIALTAEYRWEIGTGFDMAVFLDGGKVFHRPSQIGLSGLESSAGFGLRFRDKRSVGIARLDIGFSREGFQIWLKAGKLF
jgi:Omp85 superfamily domain